jgi:threonine/homoserine/homoserine lactone efflux protein
MMSLLAAPLAGIVIGFLGAVPVGPLNIAVMTDGLRGKARTALAMVAGGTVGDVIYCSVAMLGLSQVFVDTMRSLTMRLVFGIGIVLYGLLIVARGKVDLEAPTRPARFAQIHNSFWIGMLMTLLNPSLLITWALTAGVIHAWGIIGDSVIANSLFALGAGVGMAAWLSILLLLIYRNRQRIPYRVIRFIVKGFGFLLVALGIFCMFGLGLENHGAG